MKRPIAGALPLLGIMLAFALSVLPVPSSASEHDQMNAAIHAKGLKWIAGETSVAKLPPEQRRALLGLVKPPRSGAEPVLSADAAEAAPAGSFDWRYVSGGFVTPVRNQAQCGSCWAFAVTAALEAYTLISHNTPGMDLNLAEQVLVSCNGGGTCGGGWIGSASEYLRTTGLPPETCFTYTASDSACVVGCANWQASAYKIAGWSYVNGGAPTVQAIKDALYTYGPLPTTMDVYYDFFSYWSGVYSYASGAYQGGHAVLIVGYDDNNQCFIVKNSWGTGWGEAGFFRIAYSEVSSIVNFGDSTIAFHEPASVCTFSISPTSKTFTGASTGTVAVTATPGCDWQAKSNASWITILSGASGSGNGTVAYSVPVYTGSTLRTGTINVAGQTFTVKQKGSRGARK